MSNDTGESKELGIGVIGLGGMGGRHARIVGERIRGAQVRAVYDPDATRVGDLLPVLGAEARENALAVIHDPAVAAVVVASPDATHAELVLACLDAGKPVLCEKPLAQSAAEAWEVVARESSLGRRMVQVGFMRRFDPAHLAVRDTISQGPLGAAAMMRGWHRNEVSRPDIRSERVVTGSLIHDLDSTRWLMAEEIVEVRVVGQRVNENVAVGEYDLLLVECRLESGRHSLLEVFVNAGYGYEVGVEIVGSRGIVCTPPEPNPLVKLDRGAGVAVAADWLVRFDRAYERQMATWVHGLRSGEMVSGADAWDGYASLVCADACIEALRRGTCVAVHLPEQPELYGRRKSVAANSPEQTLG